MTDTVLAHRECLGVHVVRRELAAEDGELGAMRRYTCRARYKEEPTLEWTRACMHRCITNESNGVLLLQSVYSYDRIRSLTTEYVLLQMHLEQVERSDSAPNVVRGERESGRGESVCACVYLPERCAW